MSGVRDERLDEVGSDSIITGFDVKGVGSWELDIPRTVYPPREATALLAGALLGLRRHGGRATEFGGGAGAISILLATLGWEVEACDVNPLAVAATMGNSNRA